MRRENLFKPQTSSNLRKTSHYYAAKPHNTISEYEWYTAHDIVDHLYSFILPLKLKDSFVPTDLHAGMW